MSERMGNKMNGFFLKHTHPNPAKMISSHLSNFNTQMEFRDPASIPNYIPMGQTFEKLSHEIQMVRTIHIRCQPQKPVCSTRNKNLFGSSPVTSPMPR